MIVIKTRLLFQPHLQLFHTPTLIYEPYSLFLPPAHGLQEYRTPLLWHRKVEYMRCGNLLYQTDVVLGDIPPNGIHPFVH